jgi:transglutaminase-like putative cysteine protease
MSYDWAGSRIIRGKHTVANGKRWVIGNEDVLIPTDLREWISPPDSIELKKAVSEISPPVGSQEGSFDERARLVWEYVINCIDYAQDANAQSKRDFWQFPAETLALGKGDCEDCTFLLASMLLASGISPFCVRAVIGVSIQKDESSVGHSWPIYKDEDGGWRVLESTLQKDELPSEWPLADELAKPGSLPQYLPSICFNQDHVWVVDPRRF